MYTDIRVYLIYVEQNFLSNSVWKANGDILYKGITDFTKEIVLDI